MRLAWLYIYILSIWDVSFDQTNVVYVQRRDMWAGIVRERERIQGVEDSTPANKHIQSDHCARYGQRTRVSHSVIIIFLGLLYSFFFRLLLTSQQISYNDNKQFQRKRTLFHSRQRIRIWILDKQLASKYTCSHLYYIWSYVSRLVAIILQLLMLNVWSFFVPNFLCCVCVTRHRITIGFVFRRKNAMPSTKLFSSNRDSTACQATSWLATRGACETTRTLNMVSSTWHN